MGGTNCTIGIMQKNGTVKSVYCHYNGHLNYVGKLLLNEYNTSSRVKDLISLGNIHYLGHHLHPQNNNTVHTFEKPQKDVTVSYHRDNGDDLIINEFNNIDDYKNQQFIKYKYLWSNYNWYVSFDECNFVELTQHIINCGLPKKDSKVNNQPVSTPEENVF